jgi:hypothetical protein
MMGQMKRFIITIVEQRIYDVDVEAVSKIDAFNIAKKDHNDIVLIKEVGFKNGTKKTSE